MYSNGIMCVSLLLAVAYTVNACVMFAKVTQYTIVHNAIILCIVVLNYYLSMYTITKLFVIFV